MNRRKSSEDTAIITHIGIGKSVPATLVSSTVSSDGVMTLFANDANVISTIAAAPGPGEVPVAASVFPRRRALRGPNVQDMTTLRGSLPSFSSPYVRAFVVNAMDEVSWR